MGNHKSFTASAISRFLENYCEIYKTIFFKRKFFFTNKAYGILYSKPEVMITTLADVLMATLACPAGLRVWRYNARVRTWETKGSNKTNPPSGENFHLLLNALARKKKTTPTPEVWNVSVYCINANTTHEGEKKRFSFCLKNSRNWRDFWHSKNWSSLESMNSNN